MFRLASIPLLLGVAVLGVALTKETVQIANQSGLAAPSHRPIAAALDSARKRQLETPEVVLSVKYDGGSIDGIYLAQYRKETSNRPTVSVPEGTQLCLDLCHAGLGGSGCGSPCSSLIPVGLLDLTQPADSSEHDGTDEQQDDTEAAQTQSTGWYGQPRLGVCPTLCANSLGYPLCGCATEPAAAAAVAAAGGSTVAPNWGAVCAIFCTTGRYTLRGCPSCQDSGPHSSYTQAPQPPALRILDTTEGWTAWCNVQCRQGQGGAACNCDLSPFSL